MIIYISKDVVFHEDDYPVPILNSKLCPTVSNNLDDMQYSQLVLPEFPVCRVHVQSDNVIPHGTLSKSQLDSAYPHVALKSRDALVQKTRVTTTSSSQGSPTDVRLSNSQRSLPTGSHLAPMTGLLQQHTARWTVSFQLIAVVRWVHL